MAGYNSYPYTTQPNNYPYTAQSYQQPYQSYNAMQSQPQTQQASNSILAVLVNSEDEVNYYPVAAGVTVMLVSFNLGKFYLKSTSKNGVPEPLRTFPFKEDVPVSVTNQNDGLYVRQEDFKALSDKLNALIDKMGGTDDV